MCCLFARYHGFTDPFGMLILALLFFQLQAEQLTQLSHLQARAAALEQHNQQLQQELWRCESSVGSSGLGSGGGADDGSSVLLPRIGGAAMGGSRMVRVCKSAINMNYHARRARLHNCPHIVCGLTCVTARKRSRSIAFRAVDIARTSRAVVLCVSASLPGRCCPAPRCTIRY